MSPDILAETHQAAFSATRAWSAQEFASLLDQSGVLASGDRRSFALVRVTLDEAELLTLATHPDHRRLGLGRKTLSEAEKTAQNAGAAHMFLEVAEDNTAARALYDTMQYVQVGRRPGYYMPKDGAPIAALILRKLLIDA